MCRCTVAPAFVPGPAGNHPILTLARRLGYNELCGIGDEGDGTYTTEGVTKLCEELRGSAITSLECAAAP